MSTKAPDVICRPPSTQTALTLAEMHLRRWQLVARCNRCNIVLKVSLPMMIRAYGPDAVWWGRQPPCPGFECDLGVLTYAARSINGGTWVSMRAAPSATELQLWRDRQRTAYRGAR